MNTWSDHSQPTGNARAVPANAIVSRRERTEIPPGPPSRHRVRCRSMGSNIDSRARRRSFIAGLVTGLRVLWPILSGLLGIMVALGLAIGLVEGWSVQDSIYFTFVSGLTIGYGDLVPRTLLTRTLAILIGISGVLVTALVAAVAVKALNVAPPGEGEN